MADQIIFKSKFPDVIIPDDVTLPQLVLNRCQQYGSKPALVCGITGRTLTYAQLVDSVRRTTSGLARRGITKGDVVMICSPNCIEYPVVILSVASLGAVLTTTNPMYTADELLYQMRDGEAQYVISATEFTDKISSAADRYGRMKERFVLGAAQPGYTSFGDVMNDDGSHQPSTHINTREDVMILPYSSGTTGRPKGVMLTHHNIVANVLQCCQQGISIDLRPGEETYACILPFYHIYGITVISIYGLYSGNTLIVFPKFELKSYLGSIQKYKATLLHIVPPIAVLLSKSPVVDEFDLSSVRSIFSGAAPMGSDLQSNVMKRLNVNIVRQGYGMTEFSPITTMSRNEGQMVLGSGGIIIPNSLGRVVDVDTGKDVGVGKEGELWFKGPQVMKGYHKRSDATAETIDKEGWLHTGDIGRVDENGNYFIVDRLKELIKYKGLQVAPADLENLLLTHPGVADAAVIGVTDDDAGELPRAYCVRKPGVSVTEAEVIQFITDRVSPHKRLRGGVEFLTEIPKSASGKILRRLLRDKAKAQSKSKL